MVRILNYDKKIIQQYLANVLLGFQSKLCKHTNFLDLLLADWWNYFVLECTLKYGIAKRFILKDLKYIKNHWLWGWLHMQIKNEFFYFYFFFLIKKKCKWLLYIKKYINSNPLLVLFLYILNWYSLLLIPFQSHCTYKFSWKRSLGGGGGGDTHGDSFLSQITTSLRQLIKLLHWTLNVAICGYLSNTPKPSS